MLRSCFGHTGDLTHTVNGAWFFLTVDPEYLFRLFPFNNLLKMLTIQELIEAFFVDFYIKVVVACFLKLRSTNLFLYTESSQLMAGYCTSAASPEPK